LPEDVFYLRIKKKKEIYTVVCSFWSKIITGRGVGIQGMSSAGTFDNHKEEICVSWFWMLL